MQHTKWRYRRPSAIRELGWRLHPEAITDAWYNAQCPPRLDWRAAGISTATYLRWRVACVLRGAHTAREVAT